jgi:hypothetical protein
MLMARPSQRNVVEPITRGFCRLSHRNLLCQLEGQVVRPFEDAIVTPEAAFWSKRIRTSE